MCVFVFEIHFLRYKSHKVFIFLEIPIYVSLKSQKSIHIASYKLNDYKCFHNLLNKMLFDCNFFCACVCMHISLNGKTVAFTVYLVLIENFTG